MQTVWCIRVPYLYYRILFLAHIQSYINEKKSGKMKQKIRSNKKCDSINKKKKKINYPPHIYIGWRNWLLKYSKKSICSNRLMDAIKFWNHEHHFFNNIQLFQEIINIKSTFSSLLPTTSIFKNPFANNQFPILNFKKYLSSTNLLNNHLS